MTAPFDLLIHGELLADIGNSGMDLCLSTLEVLGGEGDTVSDLLHLSFAQATSGDCSGTDTDTGSNSGLLRIVGDGVLIQGDVVSVATDLQLLAGDVHGTQVSQHQMVISATGN